MCGGILLACPVLFCTTEEAVRKPGTPGLPLPHRTWGDFSDRKFWSRNQAGLALPSLNFSLWDRTGWTQLWRLTCPSPAQGSVAHGRMPRPGAGLERQLRAPCQKHPGHREWSIHSTASPESPVTDVTLWSLSTTTLPDSSFGSKVSQAGVRALGGALGSPQVAEPSEQVKGGHHTQPEQ